MQAQIIQTSRFDFQRIYVKAAPAKTPQAQPAKKIVRLKVKEEPQPAPAEIARPHLAKITPIAKIAPLPKVTPLPKVAPLPANCAAYTPETIHAEIDRLNKRLGVVREKLNEGGTGYAKAEKELFLIKALLKTACFIRSKIAPIPTLPKIKTVTVTGYAESVYHGTDAQILVHLRNMAKSQRVASKEGLPFEGMKMVVTHN